MAAAWASAAAAIAALGWAASTWLLTRALRRAVSDAITREQIAQISKDLAEMKRDRQAAFKQMADQIRDDRRATDQRLRWLEEHQWTGSSRAR